MYISILVLPLLGSILATNRKCGVIGGPRLSVACILIATILAMVAFYEVGISGSTMHVNLGKWIDNSNIRISWEFIYDPLTVSMFVPVMIISTCVQIYSLEYLREDPHINRFYTLISLFTVAMLLLITGDNLVVMFMGWEGVGVVSYLLVNYWYTGTGNNLAAMKALFINKIGDWGFIIGIVIVFATFGDVSISTIFATGNRINEDIILMVCMAIVIAASAKSAQISLHTWLAAAMAGPTPVSSLLHSSTMVTAGIYLLMRFSPIIELSSTTSMIILWLGSLTALLGAACGLVENDIKRIIAFSTSSQLGYMVVACGISQYSLALFHLICHAFFKSLLFLAAGAFIHSVLDNQDIRKMGSLNILTPITYSVFLLGSLSLMAAPFFSGFYSKDLILEILLVPLNLTQTVAYVFTLGAALFTTIYSIRLLMYAMFSRPNYPLSIVPFVKDSPSLMTLPIVFLSICAVSLGYLTHELFLSYGSTFYSHSIYTHPDNIRLLDAPYATPSIYGYLPLSFLLLIVLVFPFSYPIYKHSVVYISRSSITSCISSRSSNNYNSWRYSNIFDPSVMNHFNILNHYLMLYYLRLSVYIYRYWDKGLLEYLGPVGMSRLTHWIGFNIELLASGFIPHQALLLFIIVLGFLYLPLLVSPIVLILLYVFIIL